MKKLLLYCKPEPYSLDVDTNSWKTTVDRQSALTLGSTSCVFERESETIDRLQIKEMKIKYQSVRA